MGGPDADEYAMQDGKRLPGAAHEKNCRITYFWVHGDLELEILLVARREIIAESPAIVCQKGCIRGYRMTGGSTQ